MNKTIVTLFTLFSSSVLADSYIGATLQYQDANPGKKEYEQVQVAGERLDLAADSAGSSARLFAGYRFANNFGLELGYSDFSLEAGKEVVISATEDLEWDAEFDVKQFDVQVTYFYPLSEKLTLKAGAGVAHHATDFSFSHKRDLENAADEYLATGASSENKLGFTASLSLNYNIWQQLDAVVGLQYSNSSLADNSAASAGVIYRF